MDLSVLINQWQALPEAQKPARRQAVVEAINHLVQHDFARLLHLLYSVDVSEQKLKKTLQQNPQTDAAELITDLLLSRLAEKAATRKKHSDTSLHKDDEERW